MTEHISFGVRKDLAGMAVWLSLFISAVVHVTVGEIFTSTARLAKLFSSGEFVLRTLDDYISREEERIRLLKSVREELQTLGSISSDPRLNAGEHPIGAYHVVKVFHNLFREIENATANTNAFEVLLKEEDVLLPSENDSYGALSAILRLQQIYSLSTQDLMTGNIQGCRVRGLTARDAKALGDHAAAALRFQDMALEWWEAANRALSPQVTVTHQEHVDLLLKIAQAYIQLGDVENASKLVNQAVLLYAGNPDVASEVEDMRNMMEDIRTDGLDLSQLSAPEHVDFDWSGNYSGLCRGDPDAIISHPTTSFCTMTTSLGPYVPVKTEILSLHPFIALYYDVVSEKETKEFKLESFKMLQRARVGNLNDSTVSESRVGQLTWISDTVPFIKRVSKRVMAITGLDVTMRDLLSSSEPFQVVNYGIGGHYEPHFDYYPDKAALEYVPTFIKNTGERMATFLYYLDEVLAGGATVFPRIGVRVPPVKKLPLPSHVKQKLQSGDLMCVREELQTLGSISSDPRLNAGEHPIGAYHVVKVFHNLFREIENATANTNAFEVLLKEEDVLLPSENDSYGALSAILRLQQIYSLSTQDLMTGNIQGCRVRGLTARDAKALGDHAAAALRFQDMALEWWEAANRALSPQVTVTHQEHVDLLLKIAQAYIQLGDVENASKLVNQAVLLYAGNPDVASEVEDMRNMMEDIRTDGLDLSQLSAPEHVDFDWSGNYSGLCRGDPDAIISHPTTSFCTMTTSLGPYVPVKTEILSLHPFIALYYDVVSEKETKEFKLESFKMLQRARVGNLNDSTVSESRVGQLTWISDTVPFIKRVSKRVMAITGLDVTMRDLLSSSEPFQVVNYGIGGHYEPHFDYYPDKAALEYVPTFIKNTGERMATFLYYLDEVLAGGATVFPRIGVRVPPVKNAAAFWYNLQRSGEKDDRTLHAGCPVLLGQKWVANKWIREHGQAFRHGCGFSPDAQHHSFEL